MCVLCSFRKCNILLVLPMTVVNPDIYLWFTWRGTSYCPERTSQKIAPIQGLSPDPRPVPHFVPPSFPLDVPGFVLVSAWQLCITSSASRPGHPVFPNASSAPSHSCPHRLWITLHATLLSMLKCSFLVIRSWSLYLGPVLTSECENHQEGSSLADPWASPPKWDSAHQACTPGLPMFSSDTQGSLVKLTLDHTWVTRLCLFNLTFQFQPLLRSLKGASSCLSQSQQMI